MVFSNWLSWMKTRTARRATRRAGDVNPPRLLAADVGSLIGLAADSGDLHPPLAKRGFSRRRSVNARFAEPEVLEDRALLAALTVTNLNDSGSGSLRQAILDANNEGVNPGLDTINFDASLVSGGDATLNLTTFDAGTTDGTFGPTSSPCHGWGRQR